MHYKIYYKSKTIFGLRQSIDYTNLSFDEFERKSFIWKDNDDMITKIEQYSKDWHLVETREYNEDGSRNNSNITTFDNITSNTTKPNKNYNWVYFILGMIVSYLLTKI